MSEQMGHCPALTLLIGAGPVDQRSPPSGGGIIQVPVRREAGTAFCKTSYREDIRRGLDGPRVAVDLRRDVERAPERGHLLRLTLDPRVVHETPIANTPAVGIDQNVAVMQVA